jgi:uncharacterized iron-regulated protein
MKLSLNSFLLCLTAAALCAALSCRPRESAIVRVEDGREIPFAAMVEDLASVPLVFLGELHDRRSHHDAQLEVIRALAERDRPVAIGVEMFHDGHQEELDAWLAGNLSTEKFIDVYYHNWHSPWPLYRDIFLFAREKGLPMVGLNVSPDITSLVAAHGFDSLGPSQVARLPGVSCNVDPEYEKFIRQALGGHDFGGSSFRFFCEAQMVWDTAMAGKISEYLDGHPDGAMVVLAGSGHSWRHGIPDQVRKRTRIPYRIVLPEIEERLTGESASTEETDYLWTGL